MAGPPLLPPPLPVTPALEPTRHDPPSIRRDRELAPSRDYAALREAGLSYVQALSGAIWTDHNQHDPGITTLEVLCYALTDLGYRMGFTVPDLLTPASGVAATTEPSSLFPAHEVLPNTALTMHDYRRLLLRIEGVRNAWMDPMTDRDPESEVPFYLDCIDEALTYDASNTDGEDNERVRLRGLYRVLLELEIDDELGSLNESRLVYRVPRGPLKGVILSLDSQNREAFPDAHDFGPAFTSVKTVGSVQQAPQKYFDADVELELEDASVVALPLRVRVVNARPRATSEPIEPTVGQIEDLLIGGGPGGIYFNDGILALFWEKQRRRQASVRAACCVLHANRNLCEDYLSVAPVRPADVSWCADLELDPDADLEDVQARVFHAVERYLNPPIRYYSLAEMLQGGSCTDEIFNGPYVDPAFECDGERVFTKPGFIKDEDLDASELRSVVYVSDIINEVMEIEGVLSVRNVLLQLYDQDGLKVGPSQPWCLEIPPEHQPVLSIGLSKLTLLKREIPYRAQFEEFEKTLDRLRARDRKAAYVEPNQVLTPVTGRFRETDAFYSVQHDFPQTYGVGRARLPDTAPSERVALARQLKGYLTFYDQLLADYLAQLTEIRRLFSLDPDLGRTYFTRFIGDADVAGVRGGFETEFYVDAAGLKTAMGDDPDPEVAKTKRSSLTENEEVFFDRRNRALDHLIARFAERFTDYVFLMFDIDGDPLKTDEEVIKDKIAFLEDYPALSRERNQAFNAHPEDPSDLWDTDNVSGLEKRVSRLLGIERYQRRDLACEDLPKALFSAPPVGGGQFRIEIQRADGAPAFASVEVFASEAAAFTAALKVFPFVRLPTSWEVDASGGVDQVFITLVGGGVSLRHDALFENEAEASRVVHDVVGRYDAHLLSELCESEGFHVVEHILLRPTAEPGSPPADRLMSVCVGPDCEDCGDADTYSFRVSVVLPFWPERFRNPGFRRFFERTIREEAPAHVHVRVCWIGQAQMTELDAAHRSWLEARQPKRPDPPTLTAALDDLIGVLERLKTVHPKATLHDCQEGEDENMVRLNTTQLGSF